MPNEPYGPAERARLLSIQVRPGGWSWRVRDEVREYRDERGRWVRVTRDQLGNYVRERWDGQDVRIMLPALRLDARTTSIRGPQ